MFDPSKLDVASLQIILRDVDTTAWAADTHSDSSPSHNAAGETRHSRGKAPSNEYTSEQQNNFQSSSRAQVVSLATAGWPDYATSRANASRENNNQQNQGHSESDAHATEPSEQMLSSFADSSDRTSQNTMNYGMYTSGTGPVSEQHSLNILGERSEVEDDHSQQPQKDQFISPQAPLFPDTLDTDSLYDGFQLFDNPSEGFSSPHQTLNQIQDQQHPASQPGYEYPELDEFHQELLQDVYAKADRAGNADDMDSLQSEDEGSQQDEEEGEEADDAALGVRGYNECFKNAPHVTVDFYRGIMGAVEGLFYFPNHPKWAEFLLRLLGNGWTIKEIAAVMLFARGIPPTGGNFERAKDVLRKQSTVGINKQLFPHVNKWTPTRNPGDVVPVVNYNVGHMMPPARHINSLHAIPLWDFGQGVLHAPAFQDKHFFSQAVELAVAHNNHTWTTLDISQLAFHYGFTVPAESLLQRLGRGRP
ncbi:hypothetical protein LTR97_004976 [Elasticomyces elasticus]|uniref:Uncharacterized protein n=1 Tax=Elasticomyces elasticus TaxID=574655 RepID=A0AAN7VRV6_9PEZI|nr:hypothetical protein LTR97_004976 [Elasticomyces elasticus]